MDPLKTDVDEIVRESNKRADETGIVKFSNYSTRKQQLTGHPDKN